MFRRLYVWWLTARLHRECVRYQLHLEHGREVPYGACVACAPRLAKLRALRLPKAWVS